MLTLTAGFRTPNKSFLKGLLWGIGVGSITMNAYQRHKYKDLQKEYYALKEKRISELWFKR